MPDLFSWRIPVFFALALVSAMALGFAWANAGPARIYTDRNRQGLECQAAAEIASELAVDAAPQARFNPILRGFAPEELPVSALHSGMRSLFVWPLKFDCGQIFTRRGLAVVTGSPPGFTWPERYYFSRVAISTDGQRAFLTMAVSCGNECGGGFDTSWRREKNRWVLIKRTQVWVS